jgi:hypothetical protein
VLDLWGVEVPANHSTCHPQSESEGHMLEMKTKAKSFSGKFRIREPNAGPAVGVARGTFTVACVAHQGGNMEAAVILKWIADRIW